MPITATLLMSLLTMHRYEIEYRITRARAAEQHFLDEVKTFNRLFNSVDSTPSMKQKLRQLVERYSYTFAQWVTSTDNMVPLLSLIDHDTESVLPQADKIIATAQDNASTAVIALMAARMRMHDLVIWIACATVLIALACSFAIGRSITRPLGEACRGDEAARRR